MGFLSNIMTTSNNLLVDTVRSVDNLRQGVTRGIMNTLGGSRFSTGRSYSNLPLLGATREISEVNSVYLPELTEFGPISTGAVPGMPKIYGDTGISDAELALNMSRLKKDSASVPKLF